MPNRAHEHESLLVVPLVVRTCEVFCILHSFSPTYMCCDLAPRVHSSSTVASGSSYNCGAAASSSSKPNNPPSSTQSSHAVRVSIASSFFFSNPADETVLYHPRQIQRAKTITKGQILDFLRSRRVAERLTRRPFQMNHRIFIPTQPQMIPVSPMHFGRPRRTKMKTERALQQQRCLGRPRATPLNPWCL